MTRKPRAYRLDDPQVLGGAVTVADEPFDAIEAAESTGTKRAVLPDILPATTSRARSATIPTATRAAASPRLNAPINASP